MGASKAYDLLVTVGTFTDRTGQQKSRYLNIGAAMRSDNGGMFLLLDRSFNPAGVPYDASRGNAILVSMFEPKQDGQQGQAPRASAQQQADGDIPF